MCKGNKIPTIIFSIVWILFAIFFLWMGCLSLQSVNVKLPRYVCPDTGGVIVNMGELNIGVEMKKIEQSHNVSVEKLEQSIRSEATTMTAINFLSAILCLAGLGAQIWGAAIRGK